MANNLCGGSGAFPVDEACREPEVRGATSSLRYSVDDLEGALSTLFDRLESVLSPTKPATNGIEKTLGYGCPLAEQVQGQARRLQGLTAAAREITSRLEV